MKRHNHFVIHNDMGKPLLLNIEPEAVQFALPTDEEVQITDVFTAEPVTIKLSSSPGGEPILSIWPGDGKVTVEQAGVDVLDMIQIAEKARSA